MLFCASCMLDGWRWLTCCSVHHACRLSISDTLSDEEECDQETEELRKQFVQELLLSTLSLPDEKTDSEAT